MFIFSLDFIESRKQSGFIKQSKDIQTVIDHARVFLCP